MISINIIDADFLNDMIKIDRDTKIYDEYIVFNTTVGIKNVVYERRGGYTN